MQVKIPNRIPLDPTLGRQIRAARRERGVTVRALAGRVGITEQYLSLVELGHRLPGRELVEALEAELGRPFERLREAASLRRLAVSPGTSPQARVALRAAAASLELKVEEGAA